MKFLVLTVILSIIEVIYIEVARKYSIIDISREHQVDSERIARGGGIIFFFSVGCFFIYSGFQYPVFFLGLSIISSISFLDDVKSISIGSRLFFQFLSLGLIFSELGFSFPLTWIYVSCLIVCVGIINAYNFMDGINGITGGYSTVVLTALAVVNNYHIKFIANDFLIFTFLGLMVFNYFNFRTKAKCFAGDVGSISMAVIIVFLLLKLITQDHNLIYTLFLGVYGVESILTIIHRLWLKENIFKAHRLHLFQVLVHTLKIPHLVMASLYMLIQSIICCIIINSLSYPRITQVILGFSLIILLASLYVIIKRKVMALAV
jgi:UDP-N-acetylmuramyl pentapeptide phosphotransferase/UDP-N-acetylglucosamine-1-phosphate transferase